MLTSDKYLNMQNNTDYSNLKTAGNILRNGGLVIFPTETVYGIGGNGLDEKVVKKIFKAKGRASDNPLILHISDYDMLKNIVAEITPLEQKLMEKFWPGPLTIVFKKKDIVPKVVTGNLNTVGVRMPENEIALNLIRYAGIPIAAPSANISGRPSGTNIEDIKNEFASSVDYIIDGGNTKIGLESTVVVVTDEVINILRPGKITKEDLESVTNNVFVDEHILKKIEDGPVLSPGVKYRHYAPNKPCLLIYSQVEEKLIERVKIEAKKHSNPLILCSTKHLKYYDNAIDLGSTLEEISHNMFRVLRKVDQSNADIIIIEGVEAKGLGLAIMNRLLRSCSYNYIEV